MQKYYISTNSKGVIKLACPTNQVITELLEDILEIEIGDNQHIYIGYSTYIDKVFTENKEAALNNRPNFKILYQYNTELQEIRNWLADNDWKVNKFVLGEWAEDDERWQSYKRERLIKRNRYDELLQLLSN